MVVGWIWRTVRAPLTWDRWTWLRVVLLTIIMVISVAALFFLLLSGQLENIIKFLQDHRYIGLALFVAMFAILGLPIPSGYTILGMACGFIYGRDLESQSPDPLGIAEGCFTVLLGSVIGCWLGFYTTRFLFYSWVMERAAQTPTLEAFVSLIRERGFLIIVLMRICPIPFGLQNTLFALGDIGFVSYIVASVIGLAPEIFMLVYMGSTLGQVSALVGGEVHMGWLNWIMLTLEIVVSVVLVVILAVLSRQAMKRVRAHQLEREREKDPERVCAAESDASDAAEVPDEAPVRRVEVAELGSDGMVVFQTSAQPGGSLFEGEPTTRPAQPLDSAEGGWFSAGGTVATVPPPGQATFAQRRAHHLTSSTDEVPPTERQLSSSSSYPSLSSLGMSSPTGSLPPPSGRGVRQVRSPSRSRKAEALGHRRTSSHTHTL